MQPEKTRSHRPFRRFVAGVTTAVLAAASFMGSVLVTAPAAVAAPTASPEVFQMLAAQDKIDTYRDELRASFVLKVPAGSVNYSATGTAATATGLRIQYDYRGGGASSATWRTMSYRNTLNAGKSGAEQWASNRDEYYTIHKVISSGPSDYLIISVEGDLDYPDNASGTRVPGGLAANIPLRFDLYGDGGYGPQTQYDLPVHWLSGQNSATNAEGPQVQLLWDNVWSLWSGGQANWGAVLDYGLSTNAEGIFPANSVAVPLQNSAFSSAARGPAGSVSDSFWYLWVYEDGTAVTPLTSAPVQVTGVTPANGGSNATLTSQATYNATAKGSPRPGMTNSGQPELAGGAMQADGSIDFALVDEINEPSDTGYYRLLVWPEAKDPTTVTADNGGLTKQYTADQLMNADGTLTQLAQSEMWVAASAFYKYEIATPEDVVIDQPVDGSVSNNTTPVVSGTGTPGHTITIQDVTNPASPVTLVEGYDGNEVVVAADGTWTWTVPDSMALADGTYTFQVEQTEQSTGYQLTSSPVSTTFRVDLKADVAPAITAPTSGTTLTDNTPDVTGTATVDDAGSTVELFAGDELVGTATIDAAGANRPWTITLTEPLADGDYTFTAYTVDLAGNRSPVSNAVDVTVETTDVSQSEWSVTGSPATADGQAAITATVTVRDLAGQPKSGATVTFRVPAGVTVSDVVDNGDGTYTAQFTSEQVLSGEATAYVNVQGVATQIGGPEQIAFVAGDAVASTSAFDVSSTPVTADSTTGVPVTVTTRDAQGHPVAGDVVLTAPEGAQLTDGTQTGQTLTVRTDDTGAASVAVLSTTPGDYTITATVAGESVTATTNAVAHFTVGAVSAAHSSFAVTPDTTLPASGTDPFTGVVTARDAHDNPVPGAVVTLDVPAGVTATVDGTALTVSGGRATASTGADGTLTVEYTSTTAGTVQVGAGFGSDRIGALESITFTSTAPDVTNPATTWTVDKESAVADGEDRITLSITVRDGGDNPVSGLTAADFAVSTNSVVTATEVTETDEPGTYQATVSTTTAGTYPVGVQVQANGSMATIAPASRDLTFTAGEAVAGESSIEVTAGAVPVDGEHTVTVVARDAFGNPVPDAEVALSASSGLVFTGTGSGSAQTVTTGADGTATATVSSSTAGTYTVTGTIGDADVPVAAGKTNTATFAAGAAVAAESEWTVTPDTVQAADGDPQFTGVFTARDQNRNPVAGAQVILSVPTSVVTRDADGAVLPNSNGIVSVVTSDDGTVSVTFGSTQANTDPGYPVSALLGATQVGAVTNLKFAATAPDVTNAATTWALDKQQATANGTDAITATVHIADAHGNPVTGASVKVVPSDASVTASTATEVAGSPGDYRVTLSSTVAGPSTATAYVTVGGTDQVVQTSPKDIAFVAGPADADSSTYWVTGGVLAADGATPHTVTAQIADAQGNPVGSQQVTLAVQAPATFLGGAQSVVVTTAADGTAQAQVVAATAGTYQVTASVAGNQVPVATGKSGTASFGAGAADPAQSSWTVDGIAPKQADGTDAYVGTFTARDSTRNLVAGAVATIAVPAGLVAKDGDGNTLIVTGGTTSVITGADGTATVSFVSTTAGTYSNVGAYVGSTRVGDLSSLVYTAGPIDAGNSSFAVRTTSGAATVTADGTDSWTATITARDAYGNLVSGVGGLTVSSPSSQVQIGALRDNGDGTYTAQVTSRTPGSYTLSAAHGGDAIGQEQDVTFVVGAPVGAASDLTVAPDSIPADGSTTSTVTVQLRDAVGNALTQSGGTVQIYLTEGPGAVSATTDNGDGTYTATVRSSAEGTGIVSFRLNGTAVPEKTAMISYIDAEAPAAPDVDPTNGREVTGQAEPGSTVTITDAGTGEVLCTTTAAEDGSFACTPQTPIPDGTVLDVTATDENGNSSPATQVTVDAVAPDAPTVDPTDGSEVSGSAEPGSTVTVTNPETGEVLCTTTAAADGAYSCTFEPKLTDGTELEVTATDEAGNVSEPGTGVVDGQAPAAPVVDPSNGTQVSGSAEAGSTVTVYGPDGSALCTTVADADGRFVCELVPPVTVDGTTLEVTATDQVGNESDPTPVRVDTVAPGAPVIAPTNGRTISGTGDEPGNTITVTVGDQVLCTTTVAADGTWSCQPSVVPAHGTQVSATETDPAGNVSLPGTRVVDSQAPEAPKVNPTNGTEVTGTAEPGSTVTITDSGTGEVLCTTTADGAGNFACTPDQQIPDGTVIDVTATDEAGNTSPATQVTVDGAAPDAPVINPSNGTEVSGTGSTPGNTVTVTDEDGTVLCTAEVGADLTWSCVPMPQPNHGDTITAVETDELGNESLPATEVIDALAPDAPLVDPSKGDVVTGSAEPGSTVDIRTPGGVLVCTTTADPVTGAFLCDLEPDVAHGTELVVTATDAAGNTSPGTTVITDSEAPQDLVVNPGPGSPIEGTGTEPGNTVTITDPGGNELCTAVVQEDLTWSCVPSPVPGDGETITAVETDPAGNEGNPVESVIDATAPEAPQVDPTNGSEVSGTGEEEGNTITVTGPGGEVLCTATVGADLTWSCVPDPQPGDGAELSVTETDRAGNESDPTVVVVDAVAPAAPVIDPTDGSVITGKAEAGSTVVVRDAANNPLGTTTADENGDWSLIPARVPGNGEVISATATDVAGNESAPGYQTVDSEAPAPPHPVETDGETVTGEAEPGSTVTVTDPETGDVLCSTVAGEDGSFSCVMSPLPEGDTIEVTATDPAGNISDPTVVDLDNEAPNAPIVDKANGGEISGSTEPGATVKVYDPETGEVLGTATADEDGNYAVTFDPELADGREVEVTATDERGNESDPTPAVIDAIAPEAPRVDVANAVVVSGGPGAAEPGSTVVVRNADGEVLGTVTAALDGSYLVALTSPQEDGTLVYVTAEDAAGNVSPATEAVIDAAAPAAPEVDPTNGRTVTGSAEPGATVEVRDPAGTVIGSGTAAEDGSFSISLHPAQPDGTELTVTATDPNGNVSPEATVVVDAVAPDRPTLDPTNGSSVSGTAEPGSTVTVKDATGEVLCTTTADAEGGYACAFEPALDHGTQLVVTATDDAGNESLPATGVVDGLAPDAPVVHPTQGDEVSGTAEPGSTVTLTDPETGEVLCTTTAAADGSFACAFEPALEHDRTVEVTATDQAGNTSPGTQVTVDSQAPEAPVVDPTDGSEVTGVAEPGSTVNVTDPETGEVLCTTTADEDGAFRCVLEPRAEDGTTLEVEAVDEAGNTSPGTQVVVDGVAPDAPVVNPTTGDEVSGSAEPGSTVTVTGPGGQVLCTTTAAEDGSFACTPENYTPVDGDKITVTATDEAGNVSPETTVTVDRTAPDSPTVDPTDGSEVTGEAEPGSTVTVTDPETGEVLCTTTAGEDGRYTCTFEPALPDGTQLEVTATDPAGNVSEPGTGVVDGLAPDAPQVDPTNGSQVTGSAEPGSTVTITDPETGEVLCTTTAGADGAFRCVLDEQLPDGKVIEVTATDKAGNVSDPTEVVVDGAVNPKPVLDPSNGTSISGSTEPGATVTLTDKDGEVLCTVVAAEDGSFSCSFDPALDHGTEFAAVAVDEAGNVSAPATGIVDSKAPDAPKVDESKGDEITGEAEPGSTVKVTDPETGEELCSTVAGPDGSFTCTPEQPIEDGKTVEVTATDPTGNVSEPTPVVIDSTAPDAPVVDPSNGTQVTGVAEPGSTVKVHGPDGTVIGETVAGEDGSFTVPLEPQVPDGTTLEVTATDAAGNESDPTPVTVDGVAPGAPAVDPTNGKEFTGTGEEPGNTITVGVGDTVLCTTTVQADGTWSCTPSVVPGHGTEVSVTETDPAGNVSDPTVVTVDSQAPAVPVVDPTDGREVTGQAEPGSTVTVKDKDGTVLCTTTADETGNFTCVPGTSIQPGTELEVTATDQVGNESGAAKVVVGAPQGNATIGLAVTAEVIGADGAVKPAITGVGDSVRYSVVVTNTGDEPLTDVEVVPAMEIGDIRRLSGLEFAAVQSAARAAVGTGLAPGQSVTGTAVLDVAQEDIDNGTVVLSAIARAQGHNVLGELTSVAVSARVQAAVTVTGQQASATVVKTSRTLNAAGEVVDRATSVTDTVEFTFVVTNTGNVTLRDVVIVDTMITGDPSRLSAITCPVEAVGPGETMACSATYDVEAADLTGGAITNTAYVTATPPAGSGVGPIQSDTSRAVSRTVSLTADGTPVPAVGTGPSFSTGGAVGGTSAPAPLPVGTAGTMLATLPQPVRRPRG